MEVYKKWRINLHFYYFNSTIVTPISPSPKVPTLKDFTCGCDFKNLWIPVRRAPVPLPWTILIEGSPLKTQLSKYLSIEKQASSTFCPITLISDEIDFALNSFLEE